MKTVNILSIAHTRAAEQARIEAVDPWVRLVDAAGWFDGEYRETWSPYATARYLAFIEKFPNIANRVPLAHIASYLGITQSSLSRIRKNIY